jgi:hypothetical protein
MQLQAKPVYGQWLYYVTDPDQAIHWRVISGNKTVTPHQVKALEGLGVPVEVLPPDITKV